MEVVDLNPRAPHARTAIPGADEPSEPSCAMIVASGGSGSKRLLRILDQNAKTHCRNEPYNLANSPFRQLRTFPRAWVVTRDDEKVLEAQWDAAVRWTAVRMGARDCLPPPPKEHLYSLARRLGLLRAVSSRTIRKQMGFFMPGLSEEEWLLPRWLGDRTRIDQSLLVMKFNQSPGFGKWILANRKDVKVLQLVRHPAARFNSWRIRHLSRVDSELVRQRNAARLRAIRDADESWARRFGEIDQLSAEESELLFWVYETETIYRAGKGQPQYELTLDEQVVEDPMVVAKRLYRSLGLSWSGRTEEWVRAKAPHWRERATPWRDLLPARSVESVEKILDGSELRQLWDHDQLVSRIDYDWT